MTETEPDVKPPPAPRETAEDMCRGAAQDLYRAIQEIRRGKLDDLKSTTSAIRDLRAALQLAMEERSRVDKPGRHQQGAAGSYSLDFDKARAEISRRLDLLGYAG
ncbi:MAG: hypothetical protein ACKVPY_07800 [Paracoccaceae bacterium]